MVGRTISHYRIVARLGAGGMGVVYHAEDLRLGREVALKFLSDDLAHDKQAVRRLRSEARAASALNHPNICTIHDVDEQDGHPFIVMELMKGRTLRHCLTVRALKVHELVDVGSEIADALHAAHSKGIVHRDIKPGNIFLTDRNHVKILDFGLAKVTTHFVAAGSSTVTDSKTAEGLTLGTIHYMSPEQLSGEELDGRTDLFSFGVVLYECATGHHPFPGKTSALILEAILNRAPIAPIALNPRLPARLQDVINNCLEKDRELRYQSAADVRADLSRIRRDIEGGHSQATEAGWSPGPSHGAGRRQRSRVAPAAAVVAVIALMAGGSYAVWRWSLVGTVQNAGRIAAQEDAPQSEPANHPPPTRPVPEPSTPKTRTPSATPAGSPSAPPPPESTASPREQVEPSPAPPSPSVVAPPPPESSPPRPVPSAPGDDRAEPEPSAPAVPSAAAAEPAIRKVIGDYVRAIENKDLVLFRSIYPSLSSQEERRVKDSFKAVTQRVSLTILSIQPQGDEASVVLRRQDTIDVGRRQPTTTEHQQTVRMARTNGRWVIVGIR
jgi:serine/threonine protein kinase